MTNRMTCIVSDDEVHVRQRIARLAEQEGLEIVAEVADGCSALAAIGRQRPDIAFLDIRMPGLNGLALADALAEVDDPPVVVFVTAFAEHALTAFELAAVDYVVKPIEAGRFRIAVGRAREIATGRGAHRTLEAVRSVMRGERPTRITLRAGASTLSVQPSDIVRFAAADDYVEAHLVGSSHLLSVTLGALEAALESPPFVRVHRSHIVNLDRIVKMMREGGRYALAMEDGERVPVARNRENELHLARDVSFTHGKRIK